MKNEGLITTLRILGGITIALGVVFMCVLIAKFSERGPFSSGGLNPVSAFIALCVGFYHAVIGILCFGVAQMLTEAGGRRVASSSSGVSSKKTVCLKCGASYSGDHRGEFCENCGEKL
jgi:hypothetical protein